MSEGRLGEAAAHEGADDEADIIGRPKTRDAAGALLWRADIGDIALDHRTIAGRHPAKKADDESDEDVRREGHAEIAEAVGGQGPDEDRLAPHLVGEAAPERFAPEGAHGVAREDQSDLPGRGVKRGAIERQKRHDDAKAHHIDEHHRQQRIHRRRRAPLGLGQMALSCRRGGHGGAFKARREGSQGLGPALSLSGGRGS